MPNQQSRILWVVVALLLAVIAGLVVGYLSYSGSIRKALLGGLAAFGATLIGSITIMGQLGLT